MGIKKAIPYSEQGALASTDSNLWLSISMRHLRYSIAWIGAFWSWYSSVTTVPNSGMPLRRSIIPILRVRLRKHPTYRMDK